MRPLIKVETSRGCLFNDHANIYGKKSTLNTDFKAYLRPDNFLSIIKFDEVFHEEDRTSNNLLHKQNMR